jgi:hypothetical protein
MVPPSIVENLGSMIYGSSSLYRTRDFLDYTDPQSENNNSNSDNENC